MRCGQGNYIAFLGAGAIMVFFIIGFFIIGFFIMGFFFIIMPFLPFIMGFFFIMGFLAIMGFFAIAGFLAIGAAGAWANTAGITSEAARAVAAILANNFMKKSS
jgi:hypothetical protein